jgi:hypothetical protein
VKNGPFVKYAKEVSFAEIVVEWNFSCNEGCTEGAVGVIRWDDGGWVDGAAVIQGTCRWSFVSLGPKG